MKKIVFVFATFLLSTFLSAQKSQWDSTYRPGIFEMKVEQFRAFSNASTDIVFLGNSITDFTDWNELLQLREARNRGISGDVTFGVLERLDEVTEGKPAKVFILIGINDISRNIPDSVILVNYKTIIHRIKKEAPKTRIYFNTLLPVNNSFTDRAHFNKDEHILYINAELKKLGAAEKIIVIDIYPHFLDAEKKLDKKYTYDGLHLDIDGYRKWATILKPYLTK